MRKIGNISFQEELVGKMTQKEFTRRYEERLQKQGISVEKTYTDLTGKKFKASSNSGDQE